jgi:hypothetical protein
MVKTEHWRKTASREVTRQQSDVLAFADRNREIEELPAGLETGHTKRRKRGDRSDRDCIDEICELIAQGITVMVSTRFVGMPYATWHKWVKLNHEQARDKYEFAYTCHLEVMADRTLQIYEELKAQRESEMAKFIAAHDAWCDRVDNLEKEEKPPREPVYRGVVDLADILDVRGREQLADFGFEIVAIDGVDLGCDVQWHPTALGYPDRLINSLFRRNAAEKGKISWRNGLWRQKPLRQTMVNGADPPGAGNGPPLGFRNRDHWDRRKGRGDHLVLQRGDEWGRLTGK